MSDTQYQPGDVVRCPYCGGVMSVRRRTQAECRDCGSEGPVCDDPESALSAARQRHQDGSFRWGQEVVDGDGTVCRFCCVDPDDDRIAILRRSDGTDIKVNLYEVRIRPVPAPREYTLEDLPDIDDGEWVVGHHPVTSSVRVVCRDSSLNHFVSSGWHESVSDAVRNILDRIGRPFAEAAGKEGR